MALKKIVFDQIGKTTIDLAPATAGSIALMMPTLHSDLGDGSLVFRQVVPGGDPELLSLADFSVGDSGRIFKEMGIGAILQIELDTTVTPDVYIIYGFLSQPAIESFNNILDVMYAPFLAGFTLSSGLGIDDPETEQFQRNSDALMYDHEGLIFSLGKHEKPSSGMRVWRNELNTYGVRSDTLANWPLVNGSGNATRNGQDIHFESSGDRVQLTDIDFVAGEDIIYAIKISNLVLSGSAFLRILVFDGGTVFDATRSTDVSDEAVILVGSGSINSTTSGGTISIRQAGVGTVDATVTEVQVQNVSGHSNTTIPDEYAANDTAVGDSFWTDPAETITAPWADDGGGSYSIDGSQASTVDIIDDDLVAIGKKYVMSYTVTNYGGGNVLSQVGATGGATRTANGDYVDVIVATATNKARIRAQSTFIGTVSNITVHEASTGLGVATNTLNSIVTEDNVVRAVDYEHIINQLAAQWVPVAANQITDDGANGTKIKFINNSSGGTFDVDAADGVTDNDVIVIGEWYSITGEVKVKAGGDVDIRLSNVGTTVSKSVKSTEFIPFEMIGDAVGNKIVLSTARMAAGEEIYIRNLSVKRIVVTPNAPLRLTHEVDDGVHTPYTKVDVYERWPVSTAVALGKRVIAVADTNIPLSATGDGYFYGAVDAGTTDAGEPDWNDNQVGDVVTNLIDTTFDYWAGVGAGSVEYHGDFYRIIDTDATVNFYAARGDITVSDDSGQYSVVWEIQKPTTGQTTSGLVLQFIGGSGKIGNVSVTWSTETISSDIDYDAAFLIPHPTIADRFYVFLQITNDASGNTTLRHEFRAAPLAAETGQADVYGFSSVKSSHNIPPNLVFGSSIIDSFEGLFTVDNEAVWLTGGYYRIAGLHALPAATNEILQSEDFGTTWTQANAVVNTNVTMSPDGKGTADRLNDDSSTGTGQVLVNQAVFLTSGADKTFSIFAKADQLSYIKLESIAFDASGNGSTWFDLSSSAIGTTSANHAAHIEILRDGWVRCGITFQSTTDLAGLIRVFVAASDGGTSVNLDGTSSIFIWGAQAEESSFMTPYIKTTTGTETRVSENGFPQYLVSNHKDARGTLTLDVVQGASLATKGYVSVDGNRTSVMYGNVANQLATFDGTNSADIADMFEIGEAGRALVTWSEKDNEIAVRGFDADTDTEATDVYDGSYQPDTHIELSVSNPLPHYLLNLVYTQAYTDAADRAAWAGWD